MTIRKMKWGLYVILDKTGKEIAVANSWSKANKIIRKLKNK